MVFRFTDGTGTPSGSTGAIAGYSSSTGIPLAGVSGLGGQDPTDPFVYAPIRQVKAGKNTNATAAEYSSQAAPNFPGRTVSQLQADFLHQSQEKQRHWAYLLALVGYAGIDNSDPKKAAEFAKTAPLQFALDAHQKLLQDAAAQLAMGRKITPQALIREQLKYRFGNLFNGNLNSLTADGAGALGGDASLAGTKTAVSRSVDLMSPEDAKGLVRATLQQQLGRDPTQGEYEDFIATIHAAERSHPTIATQTTTRDEQGDTTNQSTTTRGGINESGYNQMLYEKAKQMPSWAEWQAVGTYAPALYAALDAPISGV
jgi:hypothetical protein